jgi:hypothetical protein
MSFQNNNYMTDEEFNSFLESIGGLENGYFTDRPPIKSAGFFSVDKGWYGIIKRLIEDLIELGWDKQILQVKEKFGGLRFYTNGISDDMHNRIRLAEDASYITCEKCGELGVIRGGGWMATLCDEHAEGREPYNNPF